MKHYWLAALLVLSIAGVSAETWWEEEPTKINAYSWWGNDKKDEEKKEDEKTEETTTDPDRTGSVVPFDPVYLQHHVVEVPIGKKDCVIRKMDYFMQMRVTKGPWGAAFKAKDPVLGLKIKLNLLENIPEKPVECVVTTQENVQYISRNIWIAQTSEHKMMYIVSFKETSTLLVIYKPRRHPLIAQWVLSDKN